MDPTKAIGYVGTDCCYAFGVVGHRPMVNGQQLLEIIDGGGANTPGEFRHLTSLLFQIRALPQHRSGTRGCPL